MPLCTLHLLQLQVERRTKSQDYTQAKYAARRQFLQRVVNDVSTRDLSARLLVACVVRRAVIVATRIDHVRLNKTPWDLLLILGPAPTSSSSGQKSTPIATSLKAHQTLSKYIADEYTLDIGIPSRIVNNYAQRTRELQSQASEQQPISLEELQQEPARSVARYVPQTSQNLEMSEDLVSLLQELDELGTSDGLVNARGQVQQLNLLSFKPSKEDKERYYQYGKGFADAAKPFGGEPKVLGSVVSPSPSQKQQQQQQPAQTKWWDEVSLVNYHSLSHFAGMAASEAYQHINRSYRLPSLDDTTIICTQEVDIAALRGSHTGADAISQQARL